MIGSPHHIQCLPDDRWRRCRLVKRVACKQDVAGCVISRQRRQFRQGIGTRLPETNPDVFGKATKRFFEMQIRGMDKSNR